MTAQIIPLITRINSIEQELRNLNEEKRGLERELDRFPIGDDAVGLRKTIYSDNRAAESQGYGEPTSNVPL